MQQEPEQTAPREATPTTGPQWVPVGSVKGPPGPPGPPGELIPDDLPDLTVIFENGLI